MESFFHSLKVEFVHQRKWATREEAKRDLFQYIEGYYNRVRIHSALGYKTPEQTERLMARGCGDSVQVEPRMVDFENRSAAYLKVREHRKHRNLPFAGPHGLNPHSP